jgi:hypothetical protein
MKKKEEITYQEKNCSIATQKDRRTLNAVAM